MLDAIPAARQLDTKIMDAWREAAKELGIRVEIPFTLNRRDGNTELYEGRVINFGGRKGIVFGTLSCDTRSRIRRTAAGYAYSDLGPDYQTYSRELFIKTLDDWKWFGAKGQEPEWYSGKNWS